MLQCYKTSRKATALSVWLNTPWHACTISQSLPIKWTFARLRTFFHPLPKGDVSHRLLLYDVTKLLRKVLLGGLQSFVHLLDAATDKLRKGYATVEWLLWVLDHTMYTAEVTQHSLPSICSLPSVSLWRQTVTFKSQVSNLGKKSDVLLPSKSVLTEIKREVQIYIYRQKPKYFRGIFGDK